MQIGMQHRDGGLSWMIAVLFIWVAKETVDCRHGGLSRIGSSEHGIPVVGTVVDPSPCLVALAGTGEVRLRAHHGDTRNLAALDGLVAEPKRKSQGQPTSSRVSSKEDGRRSARAIGPVLPDPTIGLECILQLCRMSEFGDLPIVEGKDWHARGSSKPCGSRPIRALRTVQLVAPAMAVKDAGRTVVYPFGNGPVCVAPVPVCVGYHILWVSAPGRKAGH
mmetsp:Transcript_23506/g.52022  ORF Transcript_23506/g.52022 Transcript_23506/m.52022 type:complete len:220 (+) Transcript_23506:579-1238(+)